MSSTENDGDLRAADFSPRLLELMERAPSPLPRTLLYILMLLFTSIVAWASVGQLDIVARAEGKLVPRTRLQVVQPLESGRVARIHVKEGALVKAGESLLVMDTSLSDADTSKLEAERSTAAIQRRRVEAELADAPFDPTPGEDAGRFDDAVARYEANRLAIRHAVAQQRAVLAQAEQDLAEAREIHAKLRELLPIHRAGEEAFAELGKKGFVDKMAMLDKQRERIEVERDLRAQGFAVKSLEARIRAANERINEIKLTHRQRLIDEKLTLDRRLDQVEQDIEKQRYRTDLLELKAPQAGYVKDIATHTEGSIVPAGTVLLTIVPLDDPLLAEVFVENKDVGFVRPGHTARVKVMSYEFQRYGMIDATVQHVSADAADASVSATGTDDPVPGSQGYRALLALGKQSLRYGDKSFALKPGMRVTAEINLGSRTVLEFVLSPIQRAVAEAGTER